MIKVKSYKCNDIHPQLECVYPGALMGGEGNDCLALAREHIRSLTLASENL